MYRDYIIEYSAYDKAGTIIKSGKMRVKRKLSELDAKIKFEGYLKTKLPTFNRLVVHKCYIDSIFGNIFGDDIFKSGNPFGF